jgi:hypothetical protein
MDALRTEFHPQMTRRDREPPSTNAELTSFRTRTRFLAGVNASADRRVEPQEDAALVRACLTSAP